MSDMFSWNYGNRYVECSRCGTLRPEGECVDKELCQRLLEDRLLRGLNAKARREQAENPSQSKDEATDLGSDGVGGEILRPNTSEAENPTKPRDSERRDNGKSSR